MGRGMYLLACPKPSAQNARERSSMQGTILARGCMAAAAVSGDDLDPVRQEQCLIRQRFIQQQMLGLNPHHLVRMYNQ